MSFNQISKLDEIKSSEELLVACMSFLSEENLSPEVRCNVLSKAINAASELDKDDEIAEFASQYFDILPTDVKPDVSVLMLYVPILFNKGEISRVEGLLLIWKQIAFTDKSQITDSHYLYIHGACLGIREEYKESITALKKALKLSKQNPQDGFHVNISINLGVMLFKQKKYNEALAVLEDAYHNSRVYNKIDTAGHALASFITVLISTGNEKKAQILIDSVLKQKILPGELNLHIAASIQLANILKSKKNIPEAIIMLKKMLPEVEKINEWHLSELFYNKLLTFYKLNENYKEAFYLLKICKEKSDKAFATSSETQLINTRKMMELLVKAREVKLLYKKNTQLQESNLQLEHALEDIDTLSGIIPICSRCRKLRNDEGYWNSLETYLTNHSEALLSHSICPDCMESVLQEMETLKVQK